MAKQIEDRTDEDFKDSIESVVEPTPAAIKDETEESQRHDNEYSVTNYSSCELHDLWDVTIYISHFRQAHSRMFLDELAQQNPSLGQRVVSIITPRILKRHEQGTTTYAVASPSNSDWGFSVTMSTDKFSILQKFWSNEVILGTHS